VAKKRVGKYPLSFRQMAMERMKDCPSVSALAEELGNLLHLMNGLATFSS
jgi:hypothetical protein